MGTSVYVRMAQLVSDLSSKVTDDELFTSQHYQSAIREKARVIITGTCSYLRRLGFNVDKKTERNLVGRLFIELMHDPNSNTTAKASFRGTHYSITINTATDLVLVHNSRAEKHCAILGLLYHEIGHLLFTDYPSCRAWQNQIQKGVWFPGEPEGMATADGIALDDRMKKDKGFCRAVRYCGHRIFNCLEDGYVEREIGLMCPGNGLGCLSTVNSTMIEDAPSLAKSVESDECSDFVAILQQILIYAKFGVMNFDGYDGELLDILWSALDIVDSVCFERDPIKRLSGLNEMLCLLFPFIEQEYDAAEMDDQQDDAAEALKKLLEQLASELGLQADDDQENETKSLNNPSKPTNHTSESVQKTPTEKGAKGSLDPYEEAERELKSLVDESVRETASKQVEEERTKQLNEAAESYDASSIFNRPIRVEVTRATEPTDEHRRIYEEIKPDILQTSRAMQKKIMQELQALDRMEKQRGQLFGNHLAVNTLYREVARPFTRNVRHPQPMKLLYGLLVDESYSTCGELIAAAARASLVVEDFCRSMNIQHLIYGYTSGVDDAQLFAYAELDEVDASNKYRIVDMDGRGGTPTAAAMFYLSERMKEIPADLKLLTVISDGGSGDNEMDDDGIRVISKMVTTNTKEGILTIAAGIGPDRAYVESEFGENNFLDISDIDTMPDQLLMLIKEHMIMRTV